MQELHASAAVAVPVAGVKAPGTVTARCWSAAGGPGAAAAVAGGALIAIELAFVASESSRVLWRRGRSGALAVCSHRTPSSVVAGPRRPGQGITMVARRRSGPAPPRRPGVSESESHRQSESI